MVKVTIAHDPFDKSTWKEYEYVSDVPFLLKTVFETWPQTARIYHGTVANDHDVTPACEEDIERLNTYEADLIVVVFPEDPITIFLVVAITVVAAVAFMKLPVPKTAVPTAASNRNSSSPNNELSQRSNGARVNGRIADIFGQVRSVPDLLALPYTVFENNTEIEYMYACVGRGTYQITDVRDGTTLITQIAGSSVEFYNPNTSPNSGAAFLTLGDPISEPLVSTKRITSINGQILRPSNASSVYGYSDIKFVYPNEIQTSNTETVFSDLFDSGDTIVISNASYSGSQGSSTYNQELYCTSAGEIVFTSFDPSINFSSSDVVTLSNATFLTGYTSTPGGSYPNYITLNGTYDITSVTSTKIVLTNPWATNSQWYAVPGNTAAVNGTVAKGSTIVTVDLSGTYTIASVDADTIVLSSPSTVNSDWSDLDDLSGNSTAFISPSLNSTGDKWVGPFIIEDAEKAYFNIVALNGLYKDDGTNQYATSVSFTAEFTPVDENDDPRGAMESINTTLTGSSIERDNVAATVRKTLASPGRYSFRVRRTTPKDTAFNGSVQDEVKIRDLYEVNDVPESHFGNVTTVYSRTYATSGALAVKERKLNCLATRMIPNRISGTTFSGTLYPTTRVDEILVAIARDPQIGNRPISELDVDNIYDTVQEIEDYFGTERCVSFGYTFDDDNLSFEETFETVANACFCSAYRKGNKIGIHFEKETDDSVMLFNHRNILPSTESRQMVFGRQDDNDGVEFEYTDPIDESSAIIYIPADQSAVKPRKIKLLGVRDSVPAYFHAWRAYNKIQYQCLSTEFTATHEAALLVNNDRILCADTTRTKIQDGEVKAQTVLTLTLSQPVVFEVGKTYTIFLQLYDETVESIPITAGANEYEVVLDRAPRLSLVFGLDKYAATTYNIVDDDSPRKQAFLVREKSPGDNYTYVIKAVVYDARYYAKDQDFVLGII